MSLRCLRWECKSLILGWLHQCTKLDAAFIDERSVHGCPASSAESCLTRGGCKNTCSENIVYTDFMAQAIAEKELPQSLSGN